MSVYLGTRYVPAIRSWSPRSGAAAAQQKKASFSAKRLKTTTDQLFMMAMT
jgi:hypothetical protein